MDISSLFKRAWKTYRETFSTWILLGTLFYLLPQLIFLIYSLTIPEEEFPLEMLAIFAVLLLLLILANMIYNAAIIAMSKKKGYSESLRLGLQRLPRFILLSIIFIIAMLVILLVLGLPAILAWIGNATMPVRIATIVLGVLLALAVLFWLSVKLIFSIFAIVLEDETVMEGMRTSWNIVSGRFWEVALFFLVLGVLSIVAGAVMAMFSLPFAIAGIFVQERLMEFASNIVTIVGTLFFTPFYVLLIAHAYRDLKA